MISTPRKENYAFHLVRTTLPFFLLFSFLRRCGPPTPLENAYLHAPRSFFLCESFPIFTVSIPPQIPRDVHQSANPSPLATKMFLLCGLCFFKRRWSQDRSLPAPSLVIFFYKSCSQVFSTPSAPRPLFCRVPTPRPTRFLFGRLSCSHRIQILGLLPASSIDYADPPSFLPLSQLFSSFFSPRQEMFFSFHPWETGV